MPLQREHVIARLEIDGHGIPARSDATAMELVGSNDVTHGAGTERISRTTRPVARSRILTTLSPGQAAAKSEPSGLIKFNTLLANLVIFHNALDSIHVVRDLVAEGWTITADQLAALSPYLRSHITRFGAYTTDELALRPAAFNPVLKEVDSTALDLAA